MWSTELIRSDKLQNIYDVLLVMDFIADISRQRFVLYDCLKLILCSVYKSSSNWTIAVLFPTEHLLNTSESFYPLARSVVPAEYLVSIKVGFPQ